MTSQHSGYLGQLKRVWNRIITDDDKVGTEESSRQLQQLHNFKSTKKYPVMRDRHRYRSSGLYAFEYQDVQLLIILVPWQIKATIEFLKKSVVLSRNTCWPSVCRYKTCIDLLFRFLAFSEIRFSSLQLPGREYIMGHLVQDCVTYVLQN